MEEILGLEVFRKMTYSRQPSPGRKCDTIREAHTKTPFHTHMRGKPVERKSVNTHYPSPITRISSFTHCRINRRHNVGNN
jgi:hypothetical protein